MRTGSVLFALLLCGCTRAFLPLDLQSLPTKEQHPDAKYVVLLDEQEAHYAPDGPGGVAQVRIIERLRVRVLKPTVLPALSAHYSRSFTAVESVRGRVVTADGHEEPLDLSQQSDRPVFDDSVLFTDHRVVTVPVPPIPVGAVFESEIITRYLDVKPFVLRQYFGDEVPVKISRLIVTTPPDWSVRWTLLSFDGKPFAPTEEQVDGLKRWTFERKDLPAVENDAQSPPVWAKVPLVAIRLEEWTEGNEKKKAFATPEALSSWLAEQYAQHARPTAELAATVQQILTGVPDEPTAKARALYEYTCRTIQYGAVEIGYGGWVPHDATAVHQERYGDCKDKATYLHTLLNIAGIHSAPTLIYAHSGTPMPFQLPSLGANFNHAILAIDLPDGGTVYADPTHRNVPFGQLPPSDQETAVLELRAEGAPLKRTPASDASQNIEHQTVQLRLDSQGNGQGTASLEAHGARALSIKSRVLAGTGKLNEWLAERLWNRSVHVSTTKTDLQITQDFSDAATVGGNVEARHLVVRGTQGEALLRVSDLFDSWVSFMPEDRKSDVVFQYPQTLVSTAVFELPPGTEIHSLPPDAEFSSGDGMYRITWKKRDAGLEVNRTLVRKHRTVPFSRIPEMNQFAFQVLTAEHTAAVIRLPEAKVSR